MRILVRIRTVFIVIIHQLQAELKKKKNMKHNSYSLANEMR